MLYFSQKGFDMEKIDFIISNLQTAKDKQDAAKKTGLTVRTMYNIVNNRTASPAITKVLHAYFKRREK